MNGQLRFEVLGPVRAWRGDTELELGSPQQRAVLAILLLRDGAVATPDHLVSAIWGESAPSAAVGMVRSYVSRLRRALGDGRPASVIESVGGGYALPTVPGASDVADYRRRISAAREARRTGGIEAEAAELRAALARWTGTPLAGVHGEYAEQERTQLLNSRLAAVEDLAAADLQLGRHAEAAEALVPLVGEQPLRERPRELLMLALYRAGRQAEALGLYQDTHALLGDQLGLDPGPELQEMQRRILASDPSLAGPSPEARPYPPETVELPMQLPPDLPRFIGRAQLLRQMTDALRPSAAGLPVLGLTGLAGIGKTVLAVHAGHAVAADFTDGQFFVDLASSADPPAELLRGAGVSGGAVPDDAAERARLWQSLTTGRRVLLVLDDARDADQVRRLLPGPGGAAVVVTSRKRLFGLPYADWLTLGELPEHESLALLAHMIGPDRVRSEPAEARGLVRLADGLPQVVHTIGARLSSRPAWSLATALHRLSSRGRSRRHGECAVIEDRYEDALRDLAPPQARALRLLAVPDGPDISLAAAAAVLGLPADDAECLLESLADAHLIEPGADDRYRYFSAVRTFSRSRALRDEGRAACDAAVARASGYYAATAYRALLTADPDSLRETGIREPEDAGPGFATAEAARDWLLAHGEHLRAVAAQAASIPDAPSDQLVLIVDRIAGGVGPERAPDSFARPRPERSARPLGV